MAIAAAALPSLLAYNVSPSPTFLNQALAFALWPLFVVVSSPAPPGRGPAPLWGALGLLVLAAAASWAGALPASLALSIIGSLLAAAVLVGGGAGSARSPDAEQVFAAFCWAWVVAGVINVAIAGVQVFLPDLPDGDWIAVSGLPGRAVGNLRQPNHLSSLLLWSSIAVIGLLELGRIGRKSAAALLAALVFAVVLTASRTGLVSVGLLALWGVADRRLSRPARALLLAAPLVYALAWLGMAQWAALSQHSFGGSERLAESDISSSRFAIWRDTLALIRMQPWAGVGLGEFNLAWSLTPFPHRPVAFFDHTHNLPLQLAVELGLPLALAVMALLVWALARGARNAWRAPGGLGTAQRCAMLMVLMIGLHSLLEYPLWYSYFLLPAAWAWGFALPSKAASGDSPSSSIAGSQALSAAGAGPVPPASGAMAAPLAPHARALVLASLLVLAGAALAVLDYARVAAIFSAGPDSPPLEQRIAAGQRSVLFSHHADYAAVTSGVPVPDPVHAFDRATHYLLDTRLMIAWAQSLAERHDLDAARHLAERLREFRNPASDEFFDACKPAHVPAALASAGAEADPGAVDSSGALAGGGAGARAGAGASESASADRGKGLGAGVGTGTGTSTGERAAAETGLPFQCQAPQRAPDWREFLPH